MSNKLRILVDIDNVIRAFSKYAIQKWNEEFPEKAVLSLDLWNSHDWCYSIFSGKTRLEKRTKCFNWWASKGIYTDAPVLQDACEALIQLSQMGHKIIIASHQTRDAHEDVALQTTQWLYKNNIYWDEIYYTADKAKVVGDVLIDDNANIIDNFLKKGASNPNYAIMFEYPWNMDHKFNLPKDKMIFTVRAESSEKEYWHGVLRIINNIQRRQFYV